MYAPEMHLVDRIYRMRDIKIEREGLPIILPEDEYKKHEKGGTIPQIVHLPEIIVP